MKPPRTTATSMPPEAPADSLQGQGAVSAMGVAATSEIAPVPPPQPERESAVLPLVETGPDPNGRQDWLHNL
jgi:hypothetical protein